MTLINYNIIKETFIKGNKIFKEFNGYLNFNDNNSEFILELFNNELYFYIKGIEETKVILNLLINKEKGFKIYKYNDDCYIKILDNSNYSINNYKFNGEELMFKLNNYSYITNELDLNCINITDDYLQIIKNIDKTNNNYDNLYLDKLLEIKFMNEIVKINNYQNNQKFFFRSHLINNFDFKKNRIYLLKFNKISNLIESVIQPNLNNNDKTGVVYLYYINDNDNNNEKNIFLSINIGNNNFYNTKKLNFNLRRSYNNIKFLIERNSNILYEYGFLYIFKILNGLINYNLNYEINKINFDISHNIIGYFIKCGTRFDYPSIKYINECEKLTKNDIINNFKNGKIIYNNDIKDLENNSFTNDLFNLIKKNTLLIGKLLTIDINNNKYEGYLFVFYLNYKCNIKVYIKENNKLIYLGYYSLNNLDYIIKEIYVKYNGKEFKTNSIIIDNNLYLINYNNLNENNQDLYFCYKYSKDITEKLIPPQLCFNNIGNEENNYFFPIKQNENDNYINLQGYSNFKLISFIKGNKNYLSFYSNYQYNDQDLILSNNFINIENYNDLINNLENLKSICIIYKVNNKLFKDLYKINYKDFDYSYNNYKYYYYLKSFIINYNTKNDFEISINDKLFNIITDKTSFIDFSPYYNLTTNLTFRYYINGEDNYNVIYSNYTYNTYKENLTTKLLNIYFEI